MWIYVLTLSLFLFRLHLRWLCRSSCRLAFISVFPPGIFAWLFLPDLFLPVWWNTSGLICKCQWSLTYRPILITVSNLVYNRYVLWSIMDRINLAFRAIEPSLQTIQPHIAFQYANICVLFAWNASTVYKYGISRCVPNWHFFFRMRKDSGDYWRALAAVGGLKGSRVCTAAAGLISHVTVSITSLRLALMSDSYI